jgi:heat-inducible transcriptional repressor
MPLAGRELSPREREIVNLIVRAYIETGEPVGSRTLSRMRHLSLSPATIRNVMADLADDGFLSQPHASAGRIPTDKAFRSYAGTVSAKPLSAPERDRIFNQMSSGESLEERVSIASRVLTEMTRNVGIAAALPSSSQELEHLELVALSGNRVLMILATRDKMVRNKVVTLDRELVQDELTRLRNYVNINFAGWTLERARTELLRRIEEERAMYDAVLQQLTVLCAKGLLVADRDPQVEMDGASYLVGLDLHLTRERMRDLFRALEEKKRVVALLDRFLETPVGHIGAGQVGIHVGLEDAHPAMGELTLIGVTLNLKSGVRARVAVLGPMRMHYERVIATVQQIGRTFESIHAAGTE